MEQQNLLKSRIEVLDTKDKRRILVDGNLYMSYKITDGESNRLAIVQLYETKIAAIKELAKVFQIHENSVRNYIINFLREGLIGILTKKSGPDSAWKLTSQFKTEILSIVFRHNTLNREEIARLLKEEWNEEISDKSIKEALIQSGIIENAKEMVNFLQKTIFDKSNKTDIHESTQLEFNFGNSHQEYETKVIKEDVPSTKPNLNFKLKRLSYYSEMEREYLKELEEGKYSSYGAGLLLAPMLTKYRFIETMKEVFKISTYEGYTLGQLSLTLFYFSLFEFKSIEDFKTVYPDEFGVLIGKITTPTIFTLRRFLHRIEETKQSDELISKFGQSYLKLGLVKWGTLYIDEHFLPYYGMEEITKGYWTVRDKILTGSYNFLAVDEDYSPLIFAVEASSVDLIPMIPNLIEKAKRIARKAQIPESEVDNLTVIFDRGGYSGELFRQLKEANIKFITWAKNVEKWTDKIEEDKFTDTLKVKYKIQKAKEIKYYEEYKTISKYGKIKAIIIKRPKDNKIGVIYTNDELTPSSKIVQLMCTRWGEENFIKAMKLDYYFDYMPGYVTEEIKNQPLVKNPKVEELKQIRKNLLARLSECKAKISEKLLEELDKGTKEINLEEIKNKKENFKLLADRAGLESQILLLNQEIDKLPQEVKYNEAYQEKLVRFDYEKKKFLDSAKIFSYLMEKELCQILMEEHIPPKEVWTILEMITRRGAQIKLEGAKLKVKIKSFRDGSVAYAAVHLAQRLNEMKPFTLDKYRIPISYEVE